MLVWCVFAIFGVFTGLLAGLLGIGGGLIIVPCLLYLLPLVNVPAAHVMHVAIASSLMIIVITSMASIVGHQKHHAIVWKVVKGMLIGCILGALLGGKVTDMLSNHALKIIFGLFVIFMAYQLWVTRPIAPKNSKILPGFWGLNIWGFFIAAFCTLLGTGGGSLMVPFFDYYRMPIRNAIGTSATCGFPIAVFGVIGVLLAGYDDTLHMPYMTGYIYWPAFFAMGIPAVLCAPLGTKLTHRMRTELLKKLFAVFLVLVGFNMLYKPVVTLLKLF